MSEGEDDGVCTHRHRVYFDESTKRYLLLSSISGGVVVTTIEGTSGRVSCGSTWGVDLFCSYVEAVEKGVGGATLITSFEVLIGVCATGTEALLLYSNDTTVAATLPPHHDLHTVTSLTWARLPLHPTCARNLSRAEHKALNCLLNLPLKRTKLFYSLTCDATRPYPFANPPHSYDPEYVWNLELRLPFESIGLGEICVVLIRGIVEIVDGAPGKRCLVSRMSTGNGQMGPHQNSAQDTLPSANLFRGQPLGSMATTDGFHCEASPAGGVPSGESVGLAPLANGVAPSARPSVGEAPPVLAFTPKQLRRMDSPLLQHFLQDLTEDEEANTSPHPPISSMLRQRRAAEVLATSGVSGEVEVELIQWNEGAVEEGRIQWGSVVFRIGSPVVAGPFPESRTQPQQNQEMNFGATNNSFSHFSHSNVQETEEREGGFMEALSTAVGGVAAGVVPVRDSSHLPISQGGGGAMLGAVGEAAGDPVMRLWRSLARRFGATVELFCIGVAGDNRDPKANHASPTHSSASTPAAAKEMLKEETKGRRRSASFSSAPLGWQHLTPPTPALSQTERKVNTALEGFVTALNKKVGHPAASLRVVSLPQSLRCGLTDPSHTGSVLQRRSGARSVLTCPAMDVIVELVKAALGQDGAFSSGTMLVGDGKLLENTVSSRQKVVIRLSSLSSGVLDLTDVFLGQLASGNIPVSAQGEGVHGFVSSGSLAPRVCVRRKVESRGEGGTGGYQSFTTGVAGFERKVAGAHHRASPLLLCFVLQAAVGLQSATGGRPKDLEAVPRLSGVGELLQSLLSGLPREQVLGICSGVLRHHLAVTADQQQGVPQTARQRSRTVASGTVLERQKGPGMSLETMARLGAASVEATLEGLTRLVVFSLVKAGETLPSLATLVKNLPAIAFDIDPNADLSITDVQGNGRGQTAEARSPKRAQQAQPLPYDICSVLTSPLSFIMQKPTEITEQPMLLSTLPETTLAYPVPSAVLTDRRDEDVLLAPPSNNAEPWIVPAKSHNASVHSTSSPLNATKITIILPTYSRVTEIHFTRKYAGEGTELLAPAACDILMGQGVDDCYPVFKALRLPVTPDGTCLRYTLPLHVSGEHLPASLHSGSLTEEITSRFHRGASPQRLVRVIHVVFHPLSAKAPMLLGPVHVYGFATHKLSPRSLFSCMDAESEWKQPLGETSAQGGLELLYRQLSTQGEVVRTVVANPTAEVVASEPNTPRFAGVEASQPGSPCESLRLSLSQIDASQDEDDETLGRTRGGGLLPEVARFIEQVDPPGRVGISFAEQNGSSGEPGPLDVYADLAREAIKRGLDMSKALYLECHRLSLGIPPEIRDVVLLRMGVPPASVNPSKHIFTRDPRVEARQRKHLLTGACSACASAQRFTFWPNSKLRSCEYCRRTFCKDCVAKEKLPVVEYGWTATLHEVCRTCSDDIQRQLAAVGYIRDMTSGGESAPLHPPGNGSLTRSFAAKNPALGMTGTLFNPGSFSAVETPKVLQELGSGGKQASEVPVMEQIGHAELLHRTLLRDSWAGCNVGERVAKGGAVEYLPSEGEGEEGSTPNTIEVDHLADLPHAAVLFSVPTHPHSIPIAAVFTRSARTNLVGTRNLFDTPVDPAADLRVLPPPLLAISQGTPFFAPSLKSCPQLVLHTKLVVPARVTAVVVTADCYGYTAEDALSMQVAVGDSLDAMSAVEAEWKVGVLPPNGRAVVALHDAEGGALPACRILAVTFSVANGGCGGKGDSSVSHPDAPMRGSTFIRNRVHLGTLAVCGVPLGYFKERVAETPTFSPPRTITSKHFPTAKELLQDHTEEIRRVVLKREKEEWCARVAGQTASSGGWVLDLVLDRAGMAQALMGFSVKYTEGDANVHAQARDVRVTHFRGADVQSHIPAGEFIFPSTPPLSPSYFLFPIQFTDVKQVRFEIITLHGPCAAPSRPQIDLFTSETRVHSSEAFPSIADVAPEALQRTVSSYCSSFRKVSLL